MLLSQSSNTKINIPAKLESLITQYLKDNKLGIRLTQVKVHNYNRVHMVNISEIKPSISIDPEAVRMFIEELPSEGWLPTLRIQNNKRALDYILPACWLFEQGKYDELKKYIEIKTASNQTCIRSFVIGLVDYLVKEDSVISHDIVKYLLLNRQMLNFIFKDSRCLMQLFRHSSTENNLAYLNEMSQGGMLKNQNNKKYMYALFEEAVGVSNMLPYSKIFRFKKTPEVSKGFEVKSSLMYKIDLDKKVLNKYATEKYPMLKVEYGLTPGAIFIAISNLRSALHDSVNTNYKNLLDIDSFMVVAMGNDCNIMITPKTEKFPAEFYHTLIDTFIDNFYKNYATTNGRYAANLDVVVPQTISRYESQSISTLLNEINPSFNNMVQDAVQKITKPKRLSL